MSSLGSILGTARSALSAQQQVIQTAGHNIANVSTEGYSRQRVELASTFEQRDGTTLAGTGVRVVDVRRARDVLLDVSVRHENGGEAAADTRKELLGAVEEVVGEPSETGLASTLDALWSSWSDLATSPTSLAARSVVVERASGVAATLNSFDARLLDLREQTTLRVDNTLVEVNGLAGRVAELNGRIVRAEVGGQGQAADLRDQRDVAADRLAALTGATVNVRADGSTQVAVAGYTLVDGVHARTLARTADPLGHVALAMSDAPGRPLLPLGGSTQAMVDFLNHDMQATQDQLDATANALARAVNAVHAAGRNAANAAPPAVFVDRSTAPPSFDAAASAFGSPRAPGAVTARTIAVNPVLDADPSRVATSSSASQPTGNDVALALAGLRNAATVTVGTGAAATSVSVTFVLPDRTRAPGAPDLAPSAPTTLADFYRGAVSGLAVRVQDAGSEAAVRATLAEQARTRRDSISGVNVDEELTTLMRAQQAYAAAAKVVSAADEMMQSLLQMV